MDLIERMRTLGTYVDDISGHWWTLVDVNELKWTSVDVSGYRGALVDSANVCGRYGSFDVVR